MLYHCFYSTLSTENRPEGSPFYKGPPFGPNINWLLSCSRLIEGTREYTRYRFCSYRYSRRQLQQSVQSVTLLWWKLIIFYRSCVNSRLNSFINTIFLGYRIYYTT